MTAPLPLEGMTVLDVSSFIAAPAAAVVLGDYGADVIKVEPPGEGDPHRVNVKLPHLPFSDVNYPWHLDSRNKRSIAIDLKHVQGRPVLDRLIARADVLITNYPFPVRARLKLNYDDVAGLNPRLIYASFTGYGEAGDDKDLPGFDTNAYFSRSGIVESARYEGQPPSFGLPAQGDRASAMGFVSGILLALFQRERTGMGGHVASSLFANGIWANGLLAQAALLDRTIGARPPRDRPRNAVTNLYETKDKLWLQISAVREEKMWPGLCRALGVPHLERDARFIDTPLRRQHATVLAATVGEIIAARPRAEWQRRLAAESIPHAAIARVQELRDDAQAVAARAIVPSDIAEMPRTLATPFQIDGMTPRSAGPGPALGQHTQEILTEVGLSGEEIAALAASGAVA
ncbi:MAG: CaiB/BaiF CoA transferase family protein [Hyphomicrobiaceae bacterium]